MWFDDALPVILYGSEDMMKCIKLTLTALFKYINLASRKHNKICVEQGMFLDILALHRIFPQTSQHMSRPS